VESAYRRAQDVAEELRRDPVTATGRLLVASGALGAQEVIARYDAIAAEVTAVAEQVGAEATLDSAAAVIAPLAPDHPDLVRADAVRTEALPESAPPPGGSIFDARRTTAEPNRPSDGGDSESSSDSAAGVPDSAERTSPMTLAQAINHTLAQLLDRDGDLLVFGEDVGRKGGVYGVTKGLQRRFGARRVFDTLLDEQSVLGTALGAGNAGFVPIPEIQYLAYIHNALDQIRGEAATQQFFSAGQFRNPMVVRIASYAYQKGFGGHFHNDNSVAALRDIPGLVIASPARPDDAAAMLRTCVAAARIDGRVCLYLEPIALYHTRDLHESGDEGWLAAPGEEPVDIGRARIHGAGTDLTIITFANGLRMSLRAAQRLSQRGIHARVLDLRWLAPLPVADILQHAHATGRVLIADETRRSGGVSESVCAALIDAGFTGPITRVTSADSFVPLGPATAYVLLSEETIDNAATALVTGR
jgi:2-oxoisovalerate dehydrogenase E1 component